MDGLFVSLASLSRTLMTELSPAAIAVDDALAACIQLQGEIIRARPLAAAALRAAADQVVPPALEEEWRDRNQALALTKMVEIRLKLLAIADELTEAYAYLAQPEPEVPTDEELLFAFYEASLAEGGDTDEVTLRGLRAVLARWGKFNIRTDD